jgi:hypothetical protein
MLDDIAQRKMFLLGILFSVIFSASVAFASETNGTIDATYKYAWGENIDWINFGCDGCSARVTDRGLYGYVWSQEYGWINLAPSTSGVTNNAEGTLSGMAWSSSFGWIDFAGVTIDTNGEFSGYATITGDNSRINFNCSNGNSCSSADFKVKTDWRPARVRLTTGGGHFVIPPTPPTPPPVPPPSTPPPFLPPVVVNPIVGAVDNISAAFQSLFDSILSFFKPQNKPEKILVQIPKIAPFALSGLWNLLPEQTIRSFVFAPLPYEIRVLASKFPELDRTLKTVGINRFSDMDKLAGVTLNIPGLANILNKTIKNVGLEKLTDIDKLKGVGLNVPGLSEVNGPMTSNVGAGKIALISGLPISNFSPLAKKNLPSEFVFARANGELVDLNVALSIGDQGQVSQKISSLPGEKLRLVVKPISSARSVTGYFVFKSATPKITEGNSRNEISRSSLVASALFSLNSLVETLPEPPPAPDQSGGRAGISVENKLVLSSFEYTDPDHDGIYTADVITPTVPGEYEVITVIEYIDPTLGTRQMRLIAVVDPEGYVYEKNNGKETRIPSAIVSLYTLNSATKKYELWDAKFYQQENPQVTDVRGTYSFLVPEGSYYFEVEAPGYETYTGKVFVVIEGSGIHQNIELKSGAGFFSDLDWQTILLIVVFLLLVYNLVRGRARDRVASP